MLVAILTFLRWSFFLGSLGFLFIFLRGFGPILSVLLILWWRCIFLDFSFGIAPNHDITDKNECFVIFERFFSSFPNQTKYPGHQSHQCYKRKLHIIRWLFLRTTLAFIFWEFFWFHSAWYSNCLLSCTYGQDLR